MEFRKEPCPFFESFGPQYQKQGRTSPSRMFEALFFAPGAMVLEVRRLKGHSHSPTVRIRYEKLTKLASVLRKRDLDKRAGV